MGTGGEIPEGYLDVTLPGGRKSTILHPAYPGSIYHATKCLDALMFQFYNKNDGVRCTDLHQGVVWGTNTEQVDQSLWVHICLGISFDSGQQNISPTFVPDC